MKSKIIKKTRHIEGGFSLFINLLSFTVEEQAPVVKKEPAAKALFGPAEQ